MSKVRNQESAPLEFAYNNTQRDLYVYDPDHSFRPSQVSSPQSHKPLRVTDPELPSSSSKYQCPDSVDLAKLRTQDRPPTLRQAPLSRREALKASLEEFVRELVHKDDMQPAQDDTKAISPCEDMHPKRPTKQSLEARLAQEAGSLGSRLQSPTSPLSDPGATAGLQTSRRTFTKVPPLAQDFLKEPCIELLGHGDESVDSTPAGSGEGPVHLAFPERWSLDAHLCETKEAKLQSNRQTKHTVDSEPHDYGSPLTTAHSFPQAPQLSPSLESCSADNTKEFCRTSSSVVTPSKGARAKTDQVDEIFPQDKQGYRNLHTCYEGSKLEVLLESAQSSYVLNPGTQAHNLVASLNNEDQSNLRHAPTLAGEDVDLSPGGYYMPVSFQDQKQILRNDPKSIKHLQQHQEMSRHGTLHIDPASSAPSDCCETDLRHCDVNGNWWARDCVKWPPSGNSLSNATYLIPEAPAISSFLGGEVGMIPDGMLALAPLLLDEALWEALQETVRRAPPEDLPALLHSLAHLPVTHLPAHSGIPHAEHKSNGPDRLSPPPSLPPPFPGAGRGVKSLQHRVRWRDDCDPDSETSARHIHEEEEQERQRSPESQAVLGMLQDFMLSQALLRRSKRQRLQVFQRWRGECVRVARWAARVERQRGKIAWRVGYRVIRAWSLHAGELHKNKSTEASRRVVLWAGFRAWASEARNSRAESYPGNSMTPFRRQDKAQQPLQLRCIEQTQGELLCSDGDGTSSSWVEGERADLYAHMAKMRQALSQAEERIFELERELMASKHEENVTQSTNIMLRDELNAARHMFKDVAEIEIYLHALRQHGVIHL